MIAGVFARIAVVEYIEPLKYRVWYYDRVKNERIWSHVLVGTDTLTLFLKEKGLVDAFWVGLSILILIGFGVFAFAIVNAQAV